MEILSHKKRNASCVRACVRAVPKKGVTKVVGHTNHRPCFELAQASRRPVASATLHASTSEAVQTPTICIVRPLLRPAAFWCLGLFHMAF